MCRIGQTLVVVLFHLKCRMFKLERMNVYTHVCTHTRTCSSQMEKVCEMYVKVTWMHVSRKCLNWNSAIHNCSFLHQSSVYAVCVRELIRDFKFLLELRLKNTISIISALRSHFFSCVLEQMKEQCLLAFLILFLFTLIWPSLRTELNHVPWLVFVGPLVRF